MEGLEYSPVRCYVEDETIVMVMRTPLRFWEYEEPVCYKAYRFRKNDIINEIKNLRKKSCIIKVEKVEKGLCINILQDIYAKSAAILKPSPCIRQRGDIWI